MYALFFRSGNVEDCYFPISFYKVEIRLFNALTVDLEDWYQTHDLDIAVDRWSSFEDRIQYSTGVLLELLSRYQLKATFFVLGCLASKHPHLIAEIAAAGHEIGSHGYWHRLVYRQTREEFRNDLLSSKRILEDITGKEINMYRAPSWSICSNSLWALEILEDEGFGCDSSIMPFKTPLSGISGAPAAPYYPVVGGRRLNLLEFPPTTMQIGSFHLPFAGGFYLRALPRVIVSSALAFVNKSQPGMVYVHPWEIDAGQPRLNTKAVINLIHYLNLNKTVKKLEHLFRIFRFVPLGDFITMGSYPSIPIKINNGA